MPTAAILGPFAKLGLVLTGLLWFMQVAFAQSEPPAQWGREWPRTDFTKSNVAFDEILSGGPPKDGIPSIDDPKFAPVGSVTNLGATEPVISLVIDGQARAYPLRILMWHEIVNDSLAGRPVTVTYCPLCNASIVFDRRLDGRVLDFGTTGKLRHSDLVMYDRQTESWWQQFVGQAIVGEMTGKTLHILPSRLDSFGRFKNAHPDGQVLVPRNPGLRDYGRNPYYGYDQAERPFLYRGDLPKGIPAMARVVAVGDQAWSLARLRRETRIEAGGLVLTWEGGQVSALETGRTAQGRDVGNVVVRRASDGGDVVHHVTFAFVFHAFMPNGVIHK